MQLKIAYVGFAMSMAIYVKDKSDSADWLMVGAFVYLVFQIAVEHSAAVKAALKQEQEETET